jgi:thioesterase domain-containing protein
MVAANAKAVEVYLFKGAGDFSFLNEDAHFSRGLDRIAEALKGEGIHAEVRRYGATADALRTIRSRKPKSVAFVGHSMGALAAMRMARKMRAEGIRVAYVATLDIPGPVYSAGNNVEWAENYFSMAPTFGLLTNVRRHPNARNIHVFGLHPSIDDAKQVRDGILAAIRTIHAEEQATNASPPEEPIVVVPPASVPLLRIKPKVDNFF